MDAGEVVRLVSDLETDRVERKESLANVDRVCEAICAFANDLPGHAKAGVVAVGVGDDGGRPAWRSMTSCCGAWLAFVTTARFPRSPRYGSTGSPLAASPSRSRWSSPRSRHPCSTGAAPGSGSAPGGPSPPPRRRHVWQNAGSTEHCRLMPALYPERRSATSTQAGSPRSCCLNSSRPTCSRRTGATSSTSSPASGSPILQRSRPRACSSPGSTRWRGYPAHGSSSSASTAPLWIPLWSAPTG